MDLKYSPFQGAILQDTSRFCVINSGRRTGKSYGCAIKVLMKAVNASNQNIAVVSKTFSNVKTIWLPLLRELIPEAYIEKINLSDNTIELVNGSIIYLRSGEAKKTVDSLRGMSLHHAVLDEFAFWQDAQYAWQDVILPALGDNLGTADIVSTPNGRNFFYDLHLQGKSPEYTSWSYHHGTWRDAYNREAIAEAAREAKLSVDPVTYAREWEASFEESGKSVYYSFKHEEHVATLDPIEPHEHLLIGIDFNVGINAAVVCVARGTTLQVVDEIVGASNTYDLADVIRHKYGGHRITVYPDPAGNARKTSAVSGVTDHSILRDAGFEVLSHKSTKSVMDGVNSVNSLLHRGGLMVSRGCPHTVKGLDRLSWKEDSLTIKYADDQYSHICDALRYLVEYKYSVAKTKIKRVNAPGF